MADILEKVRQDKKTLIESCFTIVDKAGKEVPFIFNAIQNLYWGERTVMDAVLKYRKPGFSSLFAAEGLSSCILEEHQNAVMVVHRDEDARILFERVHFMLSRLPFPVPTTSQGEGHIAFQRTGSTFRILTAGSRGGGRSRDITFLHLSERAQYPDERWLAGVEEACVPGARRIIETTANGSGTQFHKFWERTKRGETAYKAHFFAWWQDATYEADPPPPVGLGLLTDDEQALVEAYGVSDRKLAWRRQKLREMTDPGLFPQEYPSNDQEAFLASGRMVFDWLALAKMQSAAKAPRWRGRLRNLGPKLDLVPNGGGELTIWEMPRESGRYVIPADVAEGVAGGAYSVADVYDAHSWEQVAQWRGKIAPDLFSDVLGDLGAYYNWALVAPEVNNHGLTTCLRLRDGGYPKLYTRADEARKDSTDVGFLTNERSKTVIINRLARFIRDLEVRINSQETLEELKSFVHLENGKMGPQGGCLADCVMTAAIGGQMLDEFRESPQKSRQRYREGLGMAPRQSRGERPGGYGVRRA